MHSTTDDLSSTTYIMQLRGGTQNLLEMLLPYMIML
jgi:hypothetical protein